MRTRWFAVLALFATLGLCTQLASADQGKGKAKGHEKGNPHAAAPYDRDDDRWERHDRWETRIFGREEGRPPGWSKGKKTGWGNCGLPPGQAKKYGACRTYVYGNRRYYYYEDQAGRIIVRRPRVDIQIH